MGFNNNRITQSKSIQGLKSVMNYAEALSDFENGFNSLIGYSDGTTRPTGTFGGTASNLVKSIVTTNPLVNSKSLKIAKTGSCQGQGYYFDFTPIRADKLSASVMTIKFKIELITGTFSGSSNPSADSDLIIGIWDVANSTIIEPSTRLIESMVTGFVYDYKSEFQVPTNSTTLKLFIHHANTGSSTFEIVIDGFEVSPNQYNLGSNKSDWMQYTPTFTGFGTVSSVQVYSRRESDSLRIVGSFTSGTPTATEARITLGFNGTNANVSTATTIATNNILGSGNISIATPHTVTYLASAGNNYITMGLVLNNAGQVFTPQNGSTIAASGNVISIDALVPIAGWLSNSQSSDGYDNRVIVARARHTTGQAISSGSTDIINYETVDFDTTKNITTGSSWKFTAPSTGYYRVSAAYIFSSSSWGSNTSTSISVFKNGSLYATLGFERTDASSGAMLPSGSGSTVLQLNSGDYLDFRVSQNDGTSESLLADGNANWVSIEKIQSPVTVSSTELVSARYSTAAGATISNASYLVVDYTTKSFDTHNAVTTGAGVWKFTCPYPGLYAVKVENTITSGTGFNGTTETFGIELTKNGTTVSRKYGYPTTTSRSHYEDLSDIIDCNAGDAISARVYQDSGGSISLTTVAIENFITIKRIK